MTIRVFVAMLLCFMQAPAFAQGYQLQAVSGDRLGRSSSQGRSAERFELRSGDCHWDEDGAASFDCRTGRERVEKRSTTYDNLGQTVCYKWGVLIPTEYGETTVKSTLGQWHDTRYGDAISVRYMQGRMWLSQNIGDDEVAKITLPFLRQQWNDFVFRLRVGHKGQGGIEVWLNGRKVVDRKNIATLPDDEDRWYFKYGIYRSHLSGGAKRPVQVVYYSGVTRFTGSSCASL